MLADLTVEVQSGCLPMVDVELILAGGGFGEQDLERTTRTFVTVGGCRVSSINMAHLLTTYHSDVTCAQ